MGQVAHFLNRHGSTICYALGVIMFALLAAWAKTSSTGMTALVVAFALTVALVCFLRWRWGYWPGDEHRADMSADERKHGTFKALVGIAIMLALAVAMALFVVTYRQ